MDPVAKPNIPLKYLLIIFLLIVSFIFGYFIKAQIQQKSVPATNINPTTSPKTNDFTKTIQNQDEIIKKDWVKPASSVKGYPILSIKRPQNSASLFIYSFANKELQNTSIIPYWGSGEVGRGSSYPQVSPDLLYTVYIDKNTKVLYLLSNELLESVPISTSNVEYITGWSADSKKILYYINENTIETNTGGMGGLPIEKVSFNPLLETGFFIFNIDTGKTIRLYPVEYVETFIDSTRLLVRTGLSGSGYNDNLIVFDIDKFEADYQFVKEQFGFGAHQFTFTEDGKKWSYTLSRNPTNDANIIYADFPNKEGIQVDSDLWAHVQFPIISANGGKIAYVKQEGYIRSGVPKETTWVYDTVTQKKQKFNDGRPLLWINEEEYIASEVNIDAHILKVYLVNTTSGNIELMAEVSS